MSPLESGSLKMVTFDSEFPGELFVGLPQQRFRPLHIVRLATELIQLLYGFIVLAGQQTIVVPQKVIFQFKAVKT